jgi:hypothetical protein
MKNAQIKLAGRFKMVATKIDGSGERVVADWFDNLILDGGLNRMGTADFWTYCRVGTGSTAPSAEQSALVAQVASTNNETANVAGYDTVGNLYSKHTKTFRFAAGDAEGNLAEVGVGWAASGATLFSRALILDGMGDPTTITVLSDEYLDVTYELRHYIPAADNEFTITISGTDYDCILRACKLDEPSFRNLNTYVSALPYGYIYTGDIGTTMQLPSGTNIAIGNPTVTPAYSNNSLEQHFRVTVPVDDVMDIRSVVLSTSLGSYQCQFDPPIPKTDVNVLTLNWVVSWARRP